jgi:hypothetical protein
MAPETVTHAYYTYTPMPMEQAQGMFGVLPAWAQQQFSDTAYAMGRYRGEKSGNGLYADALAISQARAQEGLYVSPEEILVEMIETGVWPIGEPEGEGDSSGGGGYGGWGGGGFGGGGGGGGGTINLTTPQAARYYVEQAYKSILGRRPTGKEVETFIKYLREAELNSPVTQEVDASGNVINTGGFEPQILAEQMAKDEDDYTSRQGSNFMNTFLNMLTSNGGA